MNLAQPIAIYISLWRSLHPEKPVPFPGTPTSYKFNQSNAFQDTVAKMTIFVSLHPDKTGSGSYNIADEDSGRSWEMIWAKLCKYFGLEATGPADDGSITGEAWILAQKDRWAGWEQAEGLKPGIISETAWSFMTTVAYVLFVLG